MRLIASDNRLVKVLTYASPVSLHCGIPGGRFI